jgi:molybdenum cofactor cytidylyltransferase
MAVAAILLAGGESTRMGTPKPLLEWEGQTLIEYQLGQLHDATDRIVVVLGHRADEVRPFVHRAGALALINELYREGRASSVRIAAAALPEDTECVTVLNVDQPRPAAVTRRLIEGHRTAGNLITVPVFEGHRGHPPVIDGSLLPEMREVREETLGLRAVMQAHEGEIVEVEFDSPVVLLDLNEPGDYEAARKRYTGTSDSRSSAGNGVTS